MQQLIACDNIFVFLRVSLLFMLHSDTSQRRGQLVIVGTCPSYCYPGSHP